MTVPPLQRRRLLVGGGLVLAAAAGGWVLWQRSRLHGPPPELGPSPDGVAPGVLPPYITPTADFYSYVNDEEPDPITATDFELQLRNREHDRAIGLEELLALPRRTFVRTLQCVGNGKPGDDTFSWRFGGISTAEWEIVPFSALMAHVGLTRTASLFRVEGRDHWARYFPAAVLERPDFGLAVTMNGAPLPHRHGFPARVIAPGHYGELNIKWVYKAEWTERWRSEGELASELPVKPMAFATLPRWGSRTRQPELELGGLAYAGLAGVQEVWLEGPHGRWTAELLDPPTEGVWSRWQARIPLPAGWTELAIHCRDTAGRQSERLPPGEGWGKTGRGIPHDLILGRS